MLHYRARAAQAQRLAKGVIDDQLRTQLEELARQYSAIAERLEQVGEEEPPDKDQQWMGVGKSQMRTQSRDPICRRKFPHFDPECNDVNRIDPKRPQFARTAVAGQRVDGVEAAIKGATIAIAEPGGRAAKRLAQPFGERLVDVHRRKVGAISCNQRRSLMPLAMRQRRPGKVIGVLAFN